jgi:hypothetical protein
MVVVADPLDAMGGWPERCSPGCLADRRRADRLVRQDDHQDLIAALLGRLGPTVAPAGSLNNELGVPYTALRADAGTRFLVLEMGARGAGPIRYLCDIARPRVGVVLNVGVAHIGEFGSVDSIAAAKGELVEALASTRIAVLNADATGSGDGGPYRRPGGAGRRGAERPYARRA